MKYIPRLLFVLFLMASQLVDAQSEVEDKVAGAFKKLQSSETVFLHMNKDAFVSGEKFWFTAYVKKGTSMPSGTLWVGIYDVRGTSIKNNAYYLENGVAYGSLDIDMPTGSYFVKASMQPSNDEKRSAVFLQRITVNVEQAAQQILSARLELHAESTNKRLILNGKNEIHYRIQDWDNAQHFMRRLYIADDTDAIVFEGKVRERGLGKIVFTPKLLANHTLIVELFDGTLLKKELPAVVERGISVQINTLLKEDILISFEQLGNRAQTTTKKLNVAFIADAGVQIGMVMLSKWQNALKFPKSDIPKGVNLVAVFNEDGVIIAEGLIYNDFNSQKILAPFEIAIKEKKNDSIFVTIQRTDKRITSLNTSLSITSSRYDTKRLQTNAEAYRAIMNFADDDVPEISNDFYNIKNKEDLAILGELLGSVSIADFWDKTSLVKQGIPAGFSIKGRVKITGVYDDRQLILFQKSLGTFYSTVVASNGVFQVDNLIIDKSEPINLVVKLDDKELDRPEIDFTILPEAPVDNISRFIKEEVVTKVASKISLKIETAFNQDNIALDEVILKGKQRKEKARDPNLSQIFVQKKISSDDIRTFPSLARYIRSLGFRTQADSNFPSNFFVLPRSTLEPAPLIYLNGFIWKESLNDAPLYTVDEIYFEHNGVDRSPGGTIYIYQRYGQRKDPDATPVFSEVAQVGYTFPDDYKNKLLLDAFGEEVERIAAVHWDFGLQFDANGVATIGFPSYQIDVLQFQLHGYKASGHLFSQREVLRVAE